MTHSLRKLIRPARSLRSSYAWPRAVRGVPGWLCGLVFAVVLLSASRPGADVDTAAWRSFQHALGQPAWIGANADHARANTAFRPIPAPAEGDIDPGRFRLGAFLFHEGRLSADGRVACITCHAGALSGVDGRRVSLGVDNARGERNALSTVNAAFNFRQFWDGRAVTLEDQALVPIATEHEMASTLEAALEMLQNDTQYPDRFAAAYPDGVTIHNMADAIAHFQRISFTRPESAFMRHLAGEEGQLGDQALRGWRRFDEIGCVSCHNGINLGGNSYQQMGSALPYHDDHRATQAHDPGLKERSGREQDLHVFRVPALHTVATTAPYLHDGSIPTLEAAIAGMAEHQLGRVLGDPDIEDIAAFLRALSPPFGRVPVDFQGTDDVAPAHDVGGDALRRSHHEAYAAAIEAIGIAKRDLLEAARQIQAREVAHFDFLQFQHLEMIRHARALRHPPAYLDDQLREQLVAGADELLMAVSDLEWPIADLLRAQAMTWVFATHVDIPERGPLAEKVGDITARAAQQQQIVERSMQSIASSAVIPLSSALARLYPDTD